MRYIAILTSGLLLSLTSSYGAEEFSALDEQNFKQGSCYFAGQDVAQDFNKAIDCLQPLADKGHAKAQYIYGTILLNGMGIPKNPEKAFQYYTLAYKAPHVPKILLHTLEYTFATMYFNGNGVPKNETIALDYFLKSAHGGNHTAMKDLGIIYLDGHGSIAKDLPKALYWLKEAGNAGDPESSFNVGQMYYMGDAEKDISKSIEWFEKARTQGSFSATNNLAWIYLNEKKHRNLSKAYEYFQEAADCKVPQSLYMVGLMHATGEGVLRPDDEKALSYFKQAEALGITAAREEIEKIEAKKNAPLKISTEFVGVYHTRSPSITQDQVDKARKLAEEWKTRDNTF